MTPSTCERNGLDKEGIESGTTAQFTEETRGYEPRDLRLGLLLMIASAVLFYGAIGALIWQFI